MIKKIILELTCILVLAVITGCGLTSKQVVKTQSFGNATSNIGRFGEREFLNIRNGIITMNKELVAIDNTKMADSLKLDRPASVEATAKRVAASKALRLYGELLVELVTEDRAGNLQKTANSLIENTSIALKKDITDEKKESLKKIVVGLGSFFVEKKKADAVKEIIPAYQQSVDELAELLLKDFSAEDGSFGFLKAYEITAKRLKNASMRLVNAGDKYTVLERYKAVQALVIAEKAIYRATEISKKTEKTITNFKKANAELVKVIKNKKYSTDDIKVYTKQIQELIAIYQVIDN